MKALLIIDMQNDFMPNGPLEVHGALDIIDIINDLMNRFDRVYATKDWHLKDHISFASTHHKKPGDVIQVEEGEQKLWADHCIQNSFGADFVEGLHIEKIQKVFYKGSDKNFDSYSAFFDNARKRSSGLDRYLKSVGVQSIYLVGVATDYCVKYTALDGVQLGFHVYLIKDACQPIYPEKEEKMLQELKNQGVNIIESKDL